MLHRKQHHRRKGQEGAQEEGGQRSSSSGKGTPSQGEVRLCSVGMSVCTFHWWLGGSIKRGLVLCQHAACGGRPVDRLHPNSMGYP